MTGICEGLDQTRSKMERWKMSESLKIFTIESFTKFFKNILPRVSVDKHLVKFICKFVSFAALRKFQKLGKCISL